MRIIITTADEADRSVEESSWVEASAVADSEAVASAVEVSEEAALEAVVPEANSNKHLDTV